MYQHLSETSKTVLRIAGEKADTQNIIYIGTEHILLAVLEHGMGLGAQILRRFNVNFSVVEKMIHDLSRRGAQEKLFLGRLPVTPHFKNVISLAFDEAEQFNDRKVGTEYLVLAILREKGCIGEKVLRRLAVKLKDFRDMTAELKGRSLPYYRKK